MCLCLVKTCGCESGIKDFMQFPMIPIGFGVILSLFLLVYGGFDCFFVVSLGLWAEQIKQVRSW